MTLVSIELTERRDVLARAIREIRLRRSLKASTVADRMKLARRSYELLETTNGRFTHERIFDFAKATDSDPFAIILAPSFGTHKFAVDCADTKLMLITIMHLDGFYQERGSDITYLDPPNIIGAFERLFKDLGGKLDDSEAFLARWLENRTGSIGLGPLSIRGLGRRSA